MRYVEALGLAVASVASVANWVEVEAVARDPRWDRRWWSAEEAARQQLLAKVRRGPAPGDVTAALTRVTDEASRVVLGLASTAALSRSATNRAIAAAAAGAATQASCQAALAIAAGGGDEHPFALKLRLFEAGRWPLGIVDDAFFLF